MPAIFPMDFFTTRGTSQGFSFAKPIRSVSIRYDSIDTSDLGTCTRGRLFKRKKKTGKIQYPLLALLAAMKDIGDGCHQIGLNVTLVIPLLSFLLHFLDCSPLRLNGHPPPLVEWLPRPLKELLEPAL